MPDTFIDVLEAVAYARSHSFEAEVEDDESIMVRIPWSQRQPDGSLTSGVEEVGGIRSWSELRRTLGY